MSNWSRASLIVLAVALAAPRLLRLAGGAIAVGDRPVVVGEWLILLAFLLALPPVLRMRRHPAASRTAVAQAVVPLVLATLGLLMVVAFRLLPPD